MTGIGMFLFLLGYTLLWWGIKNITGESPPPFTTLLFPFGKSATA